MGVALIAFIDTNNRIMLNRRSDAKTEMWELIGGGIEAGETALAAIKREILEETGYDLQEGHDELRLVKSFQFESEKISTSVHFFRAKYPSIEAFSDSDEIYVQDLHLFEINDALTLNLLPMTRVILEEELINRRACNE